MSDRIEMVVAPTSFVMVPGDTAEATATVRNRGQTVDQFTLSVDGIDPGWYTLPVSSVALFPNDQDNLKVILQPPKTATKSGSYPLHIKITSQENPKEIATAELRIEVRAIAELELTLAPERAVGRKGVYQVIVRNPSGSEATVHLKAMDTPGRLSYHLHPDSSVVPPTGQSEAALEVRPGWSAVLFERKFDFQVQAESPGAREVKTAKGQLVSLPWYKSLPSPRLPWLTRPPTIGTFHATTEDKREFKISWSVKRATEVKLDGDDVASQGDRLTTPNEAISYVLTAKNKHGSTSQTVTIQPLPLPKARTSERIRISMAPIELQVHAGGVPVPAVVQLHNLGEIVDKFIVEVQGLDETWYSRSASSVALMPQASDQMQILFQPPKRKGVKARAYPFAVTVHSQTKPEESTIVTGQLTVLPQAEFKLGIHPYRISARRKGTYLVRLENTGVSNVNVVLNATDLDEGLRFRFKTDNPSLLGWQTIEVPMITRPKRGSTIGEKKRYDITVTANVDGIIPQSVNCELNHTPFMTSWRPILRFIRVIIVLAAIGVLVYFILKWGGGLKTLTTSPQQWVNQLIKTIEGWFFR